MPIHKTYTVEHLDPELGPWSELEYLAIAKETHRAGGTFCLSSLAPGFRVPDALAAVPGFRAENRGIEEMVVGAGEGQGDADGESKKKRVCLLDPQGKEDLSPDDRERFDVFLFGGILGDDPPRDRTSELRKKGFEGRRLGPVQMTTDTAVRVTRMVIDEQFTLNKIPYLDFPELKFNDHESTQMPFRYVKGEDGNPVMPEGMVDLIKKDTDKSIDDLF
ncbi:SAM-dependent RNA methyltransferase [Xylariomycetidae sp. FL2044]|nr:SAM-dependent RNA methyltransferase [Xylariomycetidae sp. FL2044]